MKFKKLLIYFLVIFPVFLSARERPTSPGEVKSAWMFGISSRVLPGIGYLNSKNMEMTAKALVRRNDIRKIFADLKESPLKMQVRRQYYLAKGFAIDDFEISFSIKELFDSGLLNKRIKKASRGKNRKLDLSNLKISSLRGLFDVLDKVGVLISSLDLSKNLIDIVTDDDFRFYSTGIKSLNLSYNRISILQSRCFDGLKNLYFLDLSHNRLSFLPFAIFANNGKLFKLDLSDNPLGYLKEANFIGVKKSLRYLNLGDTEFKTVPAFLKDLPNQDLPNQDLPNRDFPNLKNVHVYNNWNNQTKRLAFINQKNNKSKNNQRRRGSRRRV